MNSRISNIFFILSRSVKTEDKIREKRLENRILFFFYFHFSIIFGIIIIFLSSLRRYVAIHFISIYLRQYSFIETSLFNFPIFYKIKKNETIGIFPRYLWNNGRFAIEISIILLVLLVLRSLLCLCWAPLLCLVEQDMTMIPFVDQPIVLMHGAMVLCRGVLVGYADDKNVQPSPVHHQAEFN